jgi:hypothetical protein
MLMAMEIADWRMENGMATVAKSDTGGFVLQEKKEMGIVDACVCF